MSCIFYKKEWVETNTGEIYIFTCTCKECQEYQSDILNKNNCNEDYCRYFQEEK